jgi:hypothetical protein
MRNKTLVFLICILASVSLGCTSVQLQRNSNRQLKSLADLHDQQVLDNLARFVVNPSSTPFFAVPAAGVNQLTDGGGINGSDGVLTGKFWSHISLGTSRSINQSWDLRPVTEPNRLLLMKCAYQRAIGVTPDGCLDCCKFERAWHGPEYDCENPCGITCGWVRCSKKWKDVPQCCVGYSRFCDTYVWVDPSHRSEFSKLVMKMVEYASGSPYEEPKAQMKEVVFYYNADGFPATIGEHFKSVRATVEGDKTVDQLEKELSLSWLENAMRTLSEANQGESMESLKASNSSLKALNSLNREDAINELQEMINSKRSQLGSPSAEGFPKVDFGGKAIEGTRSILSDQQRLNTIQTPQRPR